MSHANVNPSASSRNIRSRARTYIAALLTGDADVPEDFKVPPRGRYNVYFPGHVIASQQSLRASVATVEAPVATNPFTKHLAVLLLVALSIACLLMTFVAIAFAEPLEGSKAYAVASLPASGAPKATTSTFDPAILPPIGSIGAHTDITVFLQNGVPEELQIAALRRLWTVDPAIRDFKGLQENDWHFSDLNSIPGFGELGSDVDQRSARAALQ